MNNLPVLHRPLTLPRLFGDYDLRAVLALAIAVIGYLLQSEPGLLFPVEWIPALKRLGGLLELASLVLGLQAKPIFKAPPAEPGA